VSIPAMPFTALPISKKGEISSGWCKETCGEGLGFDVPPSAFVEKDGSLVVGASKLCLSHCEALLAVCNVSYVFAMEP